MTADEIRARIRSARSDAEMEAAWLQADWRDRLWAELNAGPRGGELHDRQSQVIVENERRAA